MNNIKWRTGFGEKIYIRDMKTSHLENCIRKFNTKSIRNESYLGLKMHRWVELFNHELNRRSVKRVKLYKKVLS